VFLRAAKVTTNATPEPVAKGRKITVTGKLTRANRNTKKFGAYGGSKARLQFRAKGDAATGAATSPADYVGVR
jgi:hypothetical protein